jgi:hypothetical protein
MGWPEIKSNPLNFFWWVMIDSVQLQIAMSVFPLRKGSCEVHLQNILAWYDYFLSLARSEVFCNYEINVVANIDCIYLCHNTKRKISHIPMQNTRQCNAQCHILDIKDNADKIVLSLDTVNCVPCTFFVIYHTSNPDL